MKKHVFFHRLLIFILSAAMIFSLASCSPQKKPVPKAVKSQEEQNKPPKELEELSKAVDKMEKTLYDMYERNKKPLFIQQEELKKQSEKEGKQSQEQGKEQQSGGSGGGSSGGSEKQQGQEKQPSALELVTPQDKLTELKYEMEQMKIEVDRANLMEFDKLKKDVLELHSLWNAYEAKAVSQFVMQSSIVDFEECLNNLTKAIDKKEIYQSLLDVTQLYKYLPDFYMAYTYEAPPEIGKLRFGAKKIFLLGDKENYTAAKETLDYLTGVWLLTRPRLNKDSMDLINQFEFAASDLNKAIQDKNSMIIAAKTEVIQKVADELEKVNGKKESK